jgi:hypothetical protein
MTHIHRGAGLHDWSIDRNSIRRNAANTPCGQTSSAVSRDTGIGSGQEPAAAAGSANKATARSRQLLAKPIRR